MNTPIGPRGPHGTVMVSGMEGKVEPYLAPPHLFSLGLVLESAGMSEKG